MKRYFDWRTLIVLVIALGFFAALFYVTYLVAQGPPDRLAPTAIIIAPLQTPVPTVAR